MYALNVFNLGPGRENDYRDYSVKAGEIIFGMGGCLAPSARSDQSVQRVGPWSSTRLLLREGRGMYCAPRVAASSPTWIRGPDAVHS